MAQSMIQTRQCYNCGKIFSSATNKERHLTAKKKCTKKASPYAITEVVIIGYTAEQLEQIFGKFAIYSAKKSDVRIIGVNAYPNGNLIE